MVAMHVKDRLKTTVQEFSKQVERAGAECSKSGSIENSLPPELEETADYALEAIEQKIKNQKLPSLAQEYQSPSAENMRQHVGLVGMSSAKIMNIRPSSISPMLSIFSLIPTQEEVLQELREQIKEQHAKNEENKRKKELDDILKPKKDRFDLIHELISKQFSKLSDVEKALKTVDATMALTKVPKEPFIVPMKTGLASSGIFSLVAGSLPTVMVIKMVCVKLSRLATIKQIVAPLRNERSTILRTGK